MFLDLLLLLSDADALAPAIMDHQSDLPIVVHQLDLPGLQPSNALQFSRLISSHNQHQPDGLFQLSITLLTMPPLLDKQTVPVPKLQVKPTDALLKLKLPTPLIALLKPHFKLPNKVPITLNKLLPKHKLVLLIELPLMLQPLVPLISLLPTLRPPLLLLELKLKLLLMPKPVPLPKLLLNPKPMLNLKPLEELMPLLELKPKPQPDKPLLNTPKLLLLNTPEPKLKLLPMPLLLHKPELLLKPTLMPKLLPPLMLKLKPELPLMPLTLLTKLLLPKLKLTQLLPPKPKLMPLPPPKLALKPKPLLHNMHVPQMPPLLHSMPQLPPEHIMLKLSQHNAHQPQCTAHHQATVAQPDSTDSDADLRTHNIPIII